ncbi:MAG: hypothetical protein U5L06_16330 [Rhodovibrio sp.]|nr:hypothetical protein [Rhodovibrio sp.]
MKTLTPRSKMLSRHSAANTPSTIDSGTEIAAAKPARKKVLPRREAIRSAIGRSLASERPMSPVIMPVTQSR